MPATEMGAVFLGTDIILVHIPDIGSEIAHIGNRQSQKTLVAKEKMTMAPVITKTTTSIATTAPPRTTTVTTTIITTTSEKTNTTTAPTTVKQSEKTTSTTRPPIKVATEDTTPANGTVKGDKIYVCGFGWIDYEGGGGIGEVNEQMYQNGNKIGYFGGHSDTSKQTQKTKTTQPPGEVIIADTTPANGTIKGGMIYIICLFSFLLSIAITSLPISLLYHILTEKSRAIEFVNSSET